MTERFHKAIAASLFAASMAIALTACDSNDNPIKDNEGGTDTPGQVDKTGKFVIATTTQTTSGTSYVLVTAESLDEGTVSIVGNGLVNDGATQWIFHSNKYLYGLTYNQQNSGSTRSYILGTDGQMHRRELGYDVSRFSSYGIYNNFILSMSTGDGPASLADENGNLPRTLLMTYLDVESEIATKNDTSTGLYSMENLLDNGEYVTLSGVEQSGNLLYCGVVPMGLSAYGSANPDHIRPGCEGLIATADGGTGGGSYKKGELSGTQWPDECWVAIYSSEKMTDPVLARTDSISYPCGRYRSQYYQTVWAAENGDIYVFSSSYAETATNDIQRTKRPAGVCRIPAGTTEFDDYYCNLESQADGRSFMRCWPAGGNCFLMVMYDRPLTESGFAATDLAIFNADTRKLTYVEGLPEGVSSIGKTVYVNNGAVYIPINVTDSYPAIYRIDPITARATKGLTVEATDITGFGFMEPVEY